ncbi:Oidioi.mRNA.OKI2018_I69.XSR.g13957.t1.cds [Oikopleura dioica]|uniref:Oidioi.mRNA.OKI2018_I69.XSR.g13957.t1.cds n=1 Tax=Oikopleura dioica TaxID=34765 RepID=A0ABN7S8I5_OIKDI|nr:Oidioi.mRNA.OKI2018_I69.XSR.g13957.t1.cds [Oikopleura dioica]
MDRVSSSSSCSSSSSESDSSPTSVIEAPLPPIHSSAINPALDVSSHLEEFNDSTFSTPKLDLNHNDSTDPTIPPSIDSMSFPRQLSSSSCENMPIAPPCSLSASSENLTANTGTTAPFDTMPLHICEYCGKRFHIAGSLHAHILVHSEHRAACRKVQQLEVSRNTNGGGEHDTPCRRSSSSHHHHPRQLVHQSSGRPGRLTCPDCGKFYSSKSKLRMHQMKKHSKNMEMHVLIYL